MSLWICPICNSLYPAGTFHCPNKDCNSADLKFYSNTVSDRITDAEPINPNELRLNKEEVEVLLKQFKNEWIDRDNYDLIISILVKMRKFLESK